MRYKNETFRMTKKEQELFLTEQQAGGCPEEKLVGMRRHLRSICEYLPPDKALTKKKLKRWRQALLDRGLSVRTIETAATSAWRTRFVPEKRRKTGSRTMQSVSWPC